MTMYWESTSDENGKKTPKNIYRNMYSDTTKKMNGPRLLFMVWKGSCYKLIWSEFVVFITFYAAISLVYRFILFNDPTMRQFFELVCIYADRFSGIIPISFLTGFYVTQVVARWWDQFMSLPWPDRLALKLANFCPGADDFNRNLRRTVMRYVNLSTILMYRLVSNKVQSRFPDYDSFIEAKLMLPHEVERLKKADRITPHETTWAPLLWAMKLLTRARLEGKVTIDPPVFANLQSSFEVIEAANRKILNYGWVNFPLAYVQVSTISVFIYFTAALFGRQYLIPRGSMEDHTMFPNLTIPYSHLPPFMAHTPDFYIPFFTLAELFCYMGWIKVAETLLNPFGDDDEDFQINYLIDRNLQVSYMIVDDADRDLEIVTDPFLEAGIDIPKELPYRKKSSSAVSVPGSAGAASTVQLESSFISRFRRRKFGSRKNLLASQEIESTTTTIEVVPASEEPSSGNFLRCGSVPADVKQFEVKPNLRKMATIAGSTSDENLRSQDVVGKDTNET